MPCSLTDTQMLDWIQEQAEGGCVIMCFEVDGGVHVTLNRPGSDQQSARNVSTFRDGILRLMTPNGQAKGPAKCRPVPLDPLVSLIAEAAKRAQCRTDEVEWYSWPHVFGSTAGPGGGVGGQMFTTFQVYAFDAAGERTKWCAGQWRRWDGEMCGEW